ncbi:hypothetical protein PM082_014748 [Marasmius tenuissimus]|nr:hypothetical protein PM082_014748 [Marasmius tenuissimus]
MRLHRPFFTGIFFIGIQAFHFESLPTIITAIDPQTLTWYRDDGDSGTQRLLLNVKQGGTKEVLVGAAAADGTQIMGPLEFWLSAQYTGFLTMDVAIPTLTTTLPSEALPTTQYTNSAFTIVAVHPVVTSTGNSQTGNSRAEIIGGSVGGGVFLVVLVVIFFLLRRRRSKQEKDGRVRDFDKATAIIHPFPPKTGPVSDSSHERKALPPIPASKRNMAEGCDHRVIEPLGGEQCVGSQQPHAERGGGGGGEYSTDGDDNGPVDESRYRAMQAQIQLLMRRIERMEAEDEMPPEYVSANGSSR